MGFKVVDGRIRLDASDSRYIQSSQLVCINYAHFCNTHLMSSMHTHYGDTKDHLPIIFAPVNTNRLPVRMCLHTHVVSKDQLLHWMSGDLRDCVSANLNYTSA